MSFTITFTIIIAVAAAASSPTIYLADTADATIGLAASEMRRYLLVAKV